MVVDQAEALEPRLLQLERAQPGPLGAEIAEARRAGQRVQQHLLDALAHAVTPPPLDVGSVSVAP